MITVLLVWALAATALAIAFAVHVRQLHQRHGIALGQLAGQVEAARREASHAWARAQRESDRRSDVEAHLEKFVTDLLDRVRTTAAAAEDATKPATPAIPPSLFGPKTRAALKTKALGMPRQSRLAMEAAAERLVAEHWDDDRVALAVLQGELAVAHLRGSRASTPAAPTEA